MRRRARPAPRRRLSLLVDRVGEISPKNEWLRRLGKIGGNFPRGKNSFTHDLTLKKASYLPYDPPQLGDHRPVVAQFTKESVLGAKIPQIVPVKVRCLLSKVNCICQKYIQD